MAISNFAGTPISDTYQRVVQTDGTNLADGTGSLLTILNISSSYALTASFALNAGTTVDTGSLLTTASVNLNTITFTKGNGSTFPIIVNTGSGGGSPTFPYTGSALITGSLGVTGSISLLGSSNNSLLVRGSGTTSATTTLSIRNTNNTSSLVVLDNGDTLIGYDTYTGYKLDVNGEIRMRGTLNMFGSITGSAGVARGMNIQQSLSASANNDTLVGLDVVNNYNTGSYTGVVKWGARILGGPILNEFDENASAGLSIANNNAGSNALVSITLRSGSTAGGTLAYVPGSYGVPTFANALSLSAIGSTKLFFTANADGTGTAQDIILNTSVTNLFAPPFAPSVTIKANNNVLIGTATDSGFKLDVNGSGRFSNNLTITGSLNVTGSSVFRGNITTTGSLNVTGSGIINGAVTITGSSALLTLSPRNPLPTTGVPSASFATSGSGANLKPYFWNGSTWTALF
jgi:cytoskeletal protein CcmA (bactofilin family)